MTRTMAAFHGQRDQKWRTPSDVFEALDEEFSFDLDPCPANPGADFDGLKMDWRGARVFCNPPYNNIAPWLAKAREAECAVYLLPSRTGTQWWADYALNADEIRFIRGRIAFARADGKKSPFEWSVVLVYGKPL